MVGISLCAGYIPVFRMDRSVFANIWERKSIGGERSVCNNDEDSITMAVEASRNLFKGRGSSREELDGVFFASTTAPYKEKLSSSLIATAVDLRRQITTIDFAHSIRGGTGALKLAFDSVGCGSMRNVLAVGADCRIGYPRSDEEQIFGDGAAALLVSKENVLATFEGSYSHYHEMMDIWRKSDDIFVNTWEGRFIQNEAYVNNMTEAITGLLKKYKLEPKNISKAVFTAPDIKWHKRLVQQLGFDMKGQVVNPLLHNIGYCGTAHSLLMLVQALEESNPGDILLLASYADGADAMIFKTTREINKDQNQRRIKEYIDQKLMVSSYARFLSYKGLIETVPGEPYRTFSSATVTWREQNSIIRGHGSKCRNCGMLTYPIQRICYNCNSKDNFEEVSISDMEGVVFTYTLDNLAGRSDDPVVIQTIAELGIDKVRFYSMMTDCFPSEVKVGMPVELTFRRIYDNAGMHNYFWKCRPIREGRLNHGQFKG